MLKMPPRLIQRFCGLGSHILQDPTTTITEASMVRFAKRLNGDIDSRTPICSSCYETLEKIYRMKLRNAIAHQKNKRRGANTNSISDVSSSQKQMSQSTTTSTNGITAMISSQEQDDSENSIFDAQELRALAVRTSEPARVAAMTRSVSAEPIQQQNLSLSSSTSNSEQQNESLDSSTTRSRTPPASVVRFNTSSVAAKRGNAASKPRRTKNPIQRVSSMDHDSDDDQLVSLNAINGTRLPHIQPIPSRRQFHSSNAAIMDIYMAGTTGG